jgi:uncharacterized protein (DUF2267 family)
MSTTTRASSPEHAVQIAQMWIKRVADEFGTQDREFAYGVLRAWLQTVRDRLTVEAAAHFAAQLPDLLRGAFYAGWDPTAVPVKYNAEQFTVRFAGNAAISPHDVPRSASTVTAAMMGLLPAEHVHKLLGELPEGVRSLLTPAPADSCSP